MNKRFLNASLAWFVVKYTWFMWMANVFSVNLAEWWGLLFFATPVAQQSKTLLYVYGCMLFVYGVVFRDLRRGLASLGRLTLLHAVVALVLLARTGWPGLAIWIMTYVSLIGIYYLTQIYFPRFLKEVSGPGFEWLTHYSEKAKKFAKERPVITCFVVSVFLWIGYPLVYVHRLASLYLSLTLLSFAFMFLGVGLELYDMLTKREPQKL